jgi:phosphatidylglycerophosphate synthase
MNFKEFSDKARKPCYSNYMAMVFSRASIRLSYLFAQTSITPNQLTTLSTVLALLACLLISQLSYLDRVLGIAFWFLGYITDFCDGDIARYKNMKSEFGQWYDGVTDRFKDVCLFTAMTVLAFAESHSSLVVVAGLLALGGTITHSYAVSYGFRANNHEKDHISLERLGNTDYALMAFCIVFDVPLIFLILVAFETLGVLSLQIVAARRREIYVGAQKPGRTHSA